MVIPGTEGYCEQADSLTIRYEAVTFDDVHRDMLPLIPTTPAHVLDIGAGTGRDAAALASRGHHVVAAEPVAALRRQGQRLHAADRINWIDSWLPDLTGVRHLGIQFDLIFLTAVWMHLDEQERRDGMRTVAELVAQRGRVFISLRHGPAPSDRRMFDVPADEVIDMASDQGLHAIHRVTNEDQLGRFAVHWSYVVLQA